jgi:hypothetical protein
MTRAADRAAAAALLALAFALAGCAKSASQGQASPSPAVGATPAVKFLGTHYPSQGHRHFSDTESTDFAYNTDPPTSGPHKELFTDTFDSATPLPKYIQVHLLEHGNVLLQYNCKCPDIAGALYQIAFEYDNKLVPPDRLLPTPDDVQAGEEQGLAVVVAPYPGMAHTIALTAWTRLATLDAIDKAKIEAFINAYLHDLNNAAQ